MSRRSRSEGTELAAEIVSPGKPQRQRVVGHRVASTSEGSPRARSLLEDARSRLEAQAAIAAQRVAERLWRLGEEGLAIVEGRPEEAPAISDYVRHAADRLLEAADKAYRLADEVEAGGLQSVLGDLERLARRRPRVFLVATAAGALAAAWAIGTGGAEGGAVAKQRARRHDELEPAALDALLQRLWPGDVDDVSLPGASERNRRRVQRRGPRLNEMGEAGDTGMSTKDDPVAGRREPTRLPLAWDGPLVDDDVGGISPPPPEEQLRKAGA